MLAVPVLGDPEKVSNRLACPLRGTALEALQGPKNQLTGPVSVHTHFTHESHHIHRHTFTHPPTPSPSQTQTQTPTDTRTRTLQHPPIETIQFHRSSSQPDVHTCPKGHSAWALVHFLFGERCRKKYTCARPRATWSEMDLYLDMRLSFSLSFCLFFLILIS